MQLGKALRITKGKWLRLGGLSNTRCFRRMRSGSWFYYLLVG